MALRTADLVDALAVHAVHAGDDTDTRARAVNAAFDLAVTNPKAHQDALCNLIGTGLVDGDRTRALMRDGAPARVAAALCKVLAPEEILELFDRERRSTVLAAIADQAGLPSGVYAALAGRFGGVDAALVANPHVRTDIAATAVAGAWRYGNKSNAHHEGIARLLTARPDLCGTVYDAAVEADNVAELSPAWLAQLDSDRLGHYAATFVAGRARRVHELRGQAQSTYKVEGAEAALARAARPVVDAPAVRDDTLTEIAATIDVAQTAAGWAAIGPVLAQARTRLERTGPALIDVVCSGTVDQVIAALGEMSVALRSQVAGRCTVDELCQLAVADPDAFIGPLFEKVSTLDEWLTATIAVRHCPDVNATIQAALADLDVAAAQALFERVRADVSDRQAAGRLVEALERVLLANVTDADVLAATVRTAATGVGSRTVGAEHTYRVAAWLLDQIDGDIGLLERFCAASDSDLTPANTLHLARRLG